LGKDRAIFWADHAPPEHDTGSGLGALDAHELTELTEDAFFGASTHATRVEHDETGIVGALGGAIANALEGSLEALGVGGIHLAADRPDVVTPLTRRLVAVGPLGERQLVKENEILHTGGFGRARPSQKVNG
jgi:hypothetical protein